MYVLPGLDQMRGRQTEHQNFCMLLWVHHFHFARDAFPGITNVWAHVKSLVIDGRWNEVFDLLESMVHHLGRSFTGRMSTVDTGIVNALNDTFEHCLVGYRFIAKQITPVDSEAEANAIVEAMTSVDKLEGARHSLNRAIELLADRQSPDYANSIKESISAVEAVVMKVTGEGTLGAGLKRLEGAGLTIHPALREAWSKMYGWASDADGIRHAGIHAADADQSIAKYVLISSSAFVSYLVEVGRKSSLL